ncbi:hypothetical protein J3A83DRAFT_4211757 [Scleroderma citrinum]
MPAERSRKSSHGCHNGAQLTWTIPAEPTARQSIAFAPNVTPVTFNDPPQPADTTSEPSLFPSSTTECSPRRPTHSRKRGEDHIPRPPNAFILFRSSFIKSQHVSSEVETNHSTLSKIIGLTWQNMPHDERQIWHAKAKKALEEHRKKWPQYAFRPSHSKSKGTSEKRKVREVEPKDLKRCAKIAELLVEGKKGAELDAAIQEFDRTHVPEIITRFETPITARSFRRSSSAPVDDDKLNQPFLVPSSPSSRRMRSTSSQPSFDVPDSTKDAKFTEPHQPSNPLVTSYSCPDLSSSFDSSSHYLFPPKPQTSFALDPFAFDMAFGDSMLSGSAHVASYPCSPAEGRAPTPCYFDAAYKCEWTPSSSPQPSAPSTPQIHSPSPTFDCPSVEDHLALDSYVLGNYASNHLGVASYAAGLDVYHQPIHPSVPFAQPDFVPFSKDQFSFEYPGKPELACVDIEFSTFMSSVTATF